MFPTNTIELAKQVIKALAARQFMIVTAESCTGGLIAGCLTEISGASAVVHGGLVTYANGAKMAMLGVPEEMLAQYGAVSEQVAKAMATGAVNASGADISIAVTGIAGPGGGTPDKPVGLVHVACATRDKTRHAECRFGDNGREAVRLATIEAALKLVLEVIVQA